MQLEPEIPASAAGAPMDKATTAPPTPAPPVIVEPAPPAAALPPPLPGSSEAQRGDGAQGLTSPTPSGPAKSELGRKLLAILMSLGLGLFVADAVISLVDSSLVFICQVHVLGLLRGIVFFFAFLITIVIYGLMGFAPMIPKRWFLPITLFNPMAMLAVIPFLTYFYGRNKELDWATSLVQVVVALAILRAVLGGLKLRWPLIMEQQLAARRFSWTHLAGFVLANVVGLLPAVVVYLFLCASLAADHFSAGFLALRPSGLTVQVRKYVRNDGKTIELFPMAHVADAGFYQKVSASFPTNSIILMEGVTDDQNLLTNKITYKRMATSLGVSEQHEEFKPRQGEMVRADVDVEQFSKNTIDFLNAVMLVHAQGLNAATLLAVTQYSPPAHFEEQLFDDLLKNRNRRLLEEIHSRLAQTQHIVVPWGVAHMPEIAREIQKSGFRLEEKREIMVIGFGKNRKQQAESRN